MSTTAADIDLGTSLSTLISGKDPKDTRQQRKLSRKRISSRIPLNGVRIISDEELDRRNCKMKKNTRSGPSKEAQRDATSSNGSSAIPNKPIDVQTITLAAAGISLVAGLSFSAGYAIGRRSSGLLRVSG